MSENFTKVLIQLQKIIPQFLNCKHNRIYVQKGKNFKYEILTKNTWSQHIFIKIKDSKRNLYYI